MMLRIVKYVFLLWIAASWTACTEYTPKPRGYFRIEPPAAAYLSRLEGAPLLRLPVGQAGDLDRSLHGVPAYARPLGKRGADRAYACLEPDGREPLRGAFLRQQQPRFSHAICHLRRLIPNAPRDVVLRLHA